MKTILLADDDEDIRTVFGMSLERYYRVLEAATGTSALELTRRERYARGHAHRQGGGSRSSPCGRTRRVRLSGEAYQPAAVIEDDPGGAA